MMRNRMQPCVLCSRNTAVRLFCEYSALPMIEAVMSGRSPYLCEAPPECYRSPSGGGRGYGKAADSGSIIGIDPKSAVYVSDIRPQRVEITSSTACRISATARCRRNTKRKSPTIAAEDNLCCMISCFRVYIFNGYLWFRGIPVCRPQHLHQLSCRRRNSKLRICLCIEQGLCICMTLCLHRLVYQVCDGCQRL